MVCTAARLDAPYKSIRGELGEQTAKCVYSSLERERGISFFGGRDGRRIMRSRVLRFIVLYWRGVLRCIVRVVELI